MVTTAVTSPHPLLLYGQNNNKKIVGHSAEHSFYSTLDRRVKHERNTNTKANWQETKRYGKWLVIKMGGEKNIMF